MVCILAMWRCGFVTSVLSLAGTMLTGSVMLSCWEHLCHMVWISLPTLTPVREFMPGSLLSVEDSELSDNQFHFRLMCIALIVAWFRLLKYVRAFSVIGKCSHSVRVEHTVVHSSC